MYYVLEDNVYVYAIGIKTYMHMTFTDHSKSDKISLPTATCKAVRKS